MTETCYICWEEELDTNKFLINKICKCKSLRIHAKCFLKLNEKLHCSVCKEDYENIKVQNENKVLQIHKGIREEYSIDKYGRKHGTYKSFYPNGSIFIYCYFVSGLRHGLFRMFHLNAGIKELGNFEYGNKEDEYLKFYDNGNIMEKIYYELDELNGVHEFYDKEGTLLMICHYKNGLPHKKLILYHSNGKKWIESDYKKGVLHGRVKEWNANGILLYDVDYENDEYIGFHIRKTWKTTFSNFCKCCRRKKKVLTK
jgi:antitoxin component YwqK of YwqJK toxin-antitoxin module